MAMEKERAPVVKYEELLEIFESYIPSLSNKDVCADKESLNEILEWFDITLAGGQFEETSLSSRVREAREVAKAVLSGETSLEAYLQGLTETVEWLKLKIAGCRRLSENS